MNMRIILISLSFLSILTACEYDTLGVESPEATLSAPDAHDCNDASLVATPDAIVADAHPPDASPPPDASIPMCPHHTKGLMIGDSITVGVFKFRTPILAAGNTVVNNSVAGHAVGEQFAVWLVSPYRGDPSIDWIFVQIGINDILHGLTTAPQTVALMRVFLADIRTNNPHAVIFFGKITPSKVRLDQVTATSGPNRYQLWLDVNAGYSNFVNVLPGIANALNDGADSLRPEYDHGDHLHLSDTGYTLSATVLESWIAAAFPDVPCG
jgi:lysophospholipase L1-like esterase